MSALHDENQVRPPKQFRSDWIVRTLIDPCRRSLNAGPIGKDLLSDWAAQPVLTADEKYVAQKAIPEV
ncbi:hypothetical protein GCM10027432_03530 [Lysobacter fragariae]